MKNQLEYYSVQESKIPIFCDNNAAISLSKNAAISLSKNSILHYKAKHIEIKHHFLRDHVQMGHVDLQFASSEDQFADISTKPFVEERFNCLRDVWGMTFIEG